MKTFDEWIKDQAVDEGLGAKLALGAALVGGGMAGINAMRDKDPANQMAKVPGEGTKGMDKQIGPYTVINVKGEPAFLTQDGTIYKKSRDKFGQLTFRPTSGIK